MVREGIREVDDHVAAQLVASEVVGTWWSPVGVQDDAAPARLRRAAQALLARLGDPRERAWTPAQTRPDGSDAALGQA
jgi:hypothetical protein